MATLDHSTISGKPKSSGFGCPSSLGEMGGHPAPDFTDSPPLVLSAYGENPFYQRDCGPIFRRCEALEDKPVVNPSSITTYPDGIVIKRGSVPLAEQPSHLADAARGEIVGFSAESAARMREYCLTMEGLPAYSPFAVTLTTPKILDEGQWRSALNRFRERLRRLAKTWAGVWRIELQRRKAPHLHCVMWVPPSIHLEGIGWVDSHGGIVWMLLTKWWLAAIRETNNPAAHKYAVRVRPLDEAGGWTAYIAAHNTASKQDQLGWKGKQWGVWNRDAWRRREPIQREVSPDDKNLVLLFRVYRQWRRRTPEFRKTGRLAKANPHWPTVRSSADLIVPQKVWRRLLRVWESPCDQREQP